MHTTPFTVVDVDPPRLFSFRWTYDEGASPGPTSSLLVTFELIPSGDGHHPAFSRDGIPRAGLGGGRTRGALQRSPARLGLLPASALGDREPIGRRAMNGVVNVDDELWSAIGDPMRRRMLDLLLADGQGTATTLSARLPVTRQAVTKHLVVLDRAGLVRVSRRRGGKGVTRWTRRNWPVRSPNSTPSALPGMPGCAASRASPRRSNVLKKHK